MTDDLRARIECALGLHPAIRNGQTVPLADAVMEIVQPIADELTENEGVIKALRRQRAQAETERDQLAARVGELERQAADRYAKRVNAPLRPETIAALNERLAAGDYPVRKVHPLPETGA